MPKTTNTDYEPVKPVAVPSGDGAVSHVVIDGTIERPCHGKRTCLKIILAAAFVAVATRSCGMSGARYHHHMRGYHDNGEHDHHGYHWWIHHMWKHGHHHDEEDRHHGHHDWRSSSDSSSSESSSSESSSSDSSSFDGPEDHHMGHHMRHHMGPEGHHMGPEGHHMGHHMGQEGLHMIQPPLPKVQMMGAGDLPSEMDDES